MKTLHESAGTILIVDDIPANLSVMVDTLEQYGHRVVVAQDGQEGLLRAAIVQPDVILLDVMMPGIDGFEVCRRLRTQTATRDIPVIFMTALSDTADKVAGFKAGGTDYITKPFHIDEALARVGTHLKLRAAQRQLELQNEELQRYRDNLEQLVAERTADLRESNERLGLLSFALNHVHEAAYLIDEQSRFVYVNDEACRALGYSAEELLKKSVIDTDPGIDPKIWAGHWDDIRRNQSITMESYHRRRDGTAFPIEVGSNYFEYKGTAYSLALARDITERKAAREKLFASEQAFRALAENSPDYIARYDRECRRVYLNPAVTKVLGNPPLGTAPDVQKSLVDIPGYTAQLHRVLETGIPSAEEVRFRNEHGEVRWGHMRVVPEFGADGQVVSVLAVCRDIHEIKESEQRFRTLAENMPDVVIRYGVDGRKLYVNPAMATLLGIEGSAILGQTATETSVVIDLGDYEQLLLHTLATGEPNEVEIAVRDVSTRARTYNVRFCAERDAQGNIVGALMVARDITERKQMEASIDKERATLRAFFRALPDLAWMKDADGRYLACNPLFERFFGAPEAEIVGKTDFDFVDAELAAFFRQKDKDAAAAGRPTANEEWITFADNGQRALLETVKAPVSDARGNVIGVIGVGHDITKRKRYEETLIERARLREQIASVAQAMPGCLYTTRIDKNGVSTFPFASAGIEELFALRPEDIRDDAAPLRARYHPDDLPKVVARIRKSCETLEPFRFEVRVRHPAHGLRWVDIRSTPARLPDGTIEAHGLMIDITERKAAETELRKTYDLLQELTTRRETAREEERKRIAREIHDELGQHLTALRMGVSTLRFQFAKDNPGLAERVQEMIGLADKTIQVVRDVAAALRPAVLDSGLGPALEWTVAQFEQNSGIPCLVDVPDNCPGMDEERAMALFRIVQESLTNIARHANAKWVVLELKRQDDHYSVRICDGGRGFAPKDSRSKTFGLLGMRERALMLSGEIDIESSPGQGTIVTARIPIGVSQEAS